MKKFIIGLLVVAVLGVGGYYAYTTFFTSEEAPKQEARKTTIKKAKEPEKAGEAIKASDYSNADNWLAKPTNHEPSGCLYVVSNGLRTKK